MFFLVINVGFEGGYIVKKIYNLKDIYKEYRYIFVCSGYFDVWDFGECSEAVFFSRYIFLVWIWFIVDDVCYLFFVDLLGYRNFCS